MAIVSNQLELDTFGYDSHSQQVGEFCDNSKLFHSLGWQGEEIVQVVAVDRYLFLG